MLKAIILIVLIGSLVGCDSSTVVEEQKMTVTPLSVVFQSGDSVKTISITHNCTCPFTWNGTPVDSTNTLKAFSGTGDNTAKEVSILRANLTTDTLNAYWVVTSNGYGTDTIRATIIR
jgi:hypothetical protein